MQEDIFTKISILLNNSVHSYYIGWFLALLVVYGIFYIASKDALKSTNATDQVVSPLFIKFRNNFIIVYLLMMTADWLQGPYVYALYSKYGYGISDIGTLFLIGFGTSMALGPYIGGLSDAYGRKLTCVAFCAMYALSCATKHFASFSILAFGRVLGGICTSILMSCFETWMMHEHRARNFDPKLLGITLALAAQGNGIVAILSGLLGQAANEAVGPVGPFDLSLIILVIGGIVIATTWTENTGEAQGDGGSTMARVSKAFSILKADKRMILVGSVQSLFEGPMYIFVFMWTPALESAAAPEKISHGMIFACFMLSCFIGSGFFSFLHRQQVPLERIMLSLLFVAGCTLLAPVFTTNKHLIMFAFCLFEVCCGIFWPTAGSLRERFIPNDHRATISNIFRVPLNLIVMLSLSLLIQRPKEVVFTFAAILLFVAVLAQYTITKMPAPSANGVNDPSSSSSSAAYTKLATGKDGQSQVPADTPSEVDDFDDQP